MSSDDKNSTQFGLLDIDNLGTVNLNETNLMNFYILRKQTPADKQLFLTPELETYIEVSIKQSLVDWYKPADDGRF